LGNSYSLRPNLDGYSYTCQTAIAMTFLVMNLSAHLSRLITAFLCLYLKNTPFFLSTIIEAYALSTHSK
ncbi:MAG: IS5/IS1182 family transposase, partial [Aulosira sp. DedVER01a]